jgi:hypothetical protein
MSSAVAMRTLKAVAVSAGIVLSSGWLHGTSRAVQFSKADGIPSSEAADGALRALGEDVVGEPLSPYRLSNPARFARLEAGEWKYRITSGARRGQTERENLAPIDMTNRGETWRRTVGQDYDLYLRRTAAGDLVLPTEIAYAHEALLHFEPPLGYLIAGLEPGESRVHHSKMDVYSSKDPTWKWYTGGISATTVHAGVYRVTTPAGAFSAALVRTDYKIRILGVVSVIDTLYTFYAEGVGKVAEAEHRRISTMGLFNTDTQVGKVLESFTPASPIDIEAP